MTSSAWKAGDTPGRVSRRSRTLRLPLAGLVALLGAVAQAQPVLIVFTSTHNDPSYIAQHREWIESRPFDGLVINDYLGRNLLNTQLKRDTPNALDAGTGAVTYDAAAKGLSPVRGVFKKFRHNFSKVNFSLIGPPPLLSDEAGWKVARASAANYAKAVADTGLAGIFFDNESYLHPPLSGKKADYWLYEDQIGLAGQSPSAVPLATAVALARQRGRELMQAFTSGYPAITVIVAHGPQEGCNAWKAASGGHFAMDHYLIGAFVAGMAEGTSGAATLVDGGEDYDLRTARDFSAAREWRKGTAAGGITSLGPGKCPFMDAALAANWQGKVSIGFTLFDKQRASLTTTNWTPITDVGGFRTTLTNALRATDRYVWLYTEWQDWWGNDMEDRLQPWIQAIGAAREDVGLNAAH